MKTEMKMLPNGNYEQVASVVQHECSGERRKWRCVEWSWENKLHLILSDGDPQEDGYEAQIEVKFCPFCGYQPLEANHESATTRGKMMKGLKCCKCSNEIPKSEVYGDWFYCTKCLYSFPLQPERSKREDFWIKTAIIDEVFDDSGNPKDAVL